MAKIQINNPRQIINGGAKKYYFKVKGLGGPKGDKGDKGDTGSRGPQGPQGNAATVSVGSTTTLPVGYDATVTNSGSIYNAVLDFGIPQGPRGPQGIQGERGEPGQTGQTGPRGPQGERGTNATVYVGTTTTTNPGTQARVYNSGTDSNAVLNFEIPRGDVGPSVPLVQETGNSTTKAMSQNATTEALNNGLATKQNTLTAGNNITISGNTISAKDTTYTAGNNVQINGTTISATDTTYTAGNGLNLNGTEFSANTTVLATKSDLNGYYTKPQTNNLLAPKLEAEVVEELPTTGAEGKLYLTPKAHTTQTATGNPITATVAEDAGTIESFQLDGDTFQQSYTGKNKFDIEQYVNAILRTNGDAVSLTKTNSTTLRATNKIKQGYNFCGISIPNYTELLGKECTASGKVTLSSVDLTRITFAWNRSGVSAFGTPLDMSQNGNFSYTDTIPSTAPSDATGLMLVIYANGANGTGDVGSYVDWSELQLEVGSTATSFEPYVGGTPSPNPSYPQDINVVTGTQTISINGTNYPISLGSIELCKLGTYQDYIWKDGEDWKVHKAISTITVDGSENWVYNGDNKFNAANISGMTMPINADALCYCATHIGVLSAENGAAFTPLVADIPYATDVHKTVKTVRIKDIRFTEAQALQTWLSQNNTTIYYVVATATDTAITDTTLIAQLEAIRTASLENGANTITNSATGSNLAGDMGIDYYGYNPRNRYDKWLWLDINNEFEQIGS